MSLNQLIDTSSVTNRRYLNCKFNSVNTPSLLIDSDPGISGQVLKSTGNGIEWSNVTPVGVPGPPYAILQTNNTGTSIVWDNDIKVNNAEVDQQLIFNGSSGSNGQIVTKVGGVPTWSSFSLPSIPVGPIDSILTTTGSGVAWEDNASLKNVNIEDQLTFTGNAGTNNQIVVNNSGFPEWQDLNVGIIEPGLANQVAATNSAGNLVQWSSSLKLTSVTFSADSFQTPLSYFSQDLNYSTVLIYEDSSIDSINIQLQRVGNLVTIKIPEISFLYGASPPSLKYRQVELPANYSPGYGTLTDIESCHSEYLKCLHTTAGPNTTDYIDGFAYIGSNGTNYFIRIYTNSNITAALPSATTNTLKSPPHTFNFMKI